MPAPLQEKAAQKAAKDAAEAKYKNAFVDGRQEQVMTLSLSLSVQALQPCSITVSRCYHSVAVHTAPCRGPCMYQTSALLRQQCCSCWGWWWEGGSVGGWGA